VLLALWPLASKLPAQVVFSRRVYKERGASYQQIWNWNPADGALKALTSSARDHYRPVCKGDAITFVSPEAFAPEAKLWSFDRKSGLERVTGPAPQLPDEEQANAPAKSCDHFASSAGMDACAKEEDLTLRARGRRSRISIYR
jgi:hypothetical protein